MMEYKFDKKLLIEGEKLSKDEITEYIAKNVAEIVCNLTTPIGDISNNKK